MKKIILALLLICGSANAEIISSTPLGNPVAVVNGGSGRSSLLSDNTMFAIGDSRAANWYIDYYHISEATTSPYVWANFLLDRPFNATGTAAVSGSRTDHLLSTGTITSGVITSSGSGYVDGTYYDVALTGGSGGQARGTVLISGGSVTAVTLTPINSFQNIGYGYAIGDVLSVSNSSVGGSGAGFSYTVSKIQTQVEAAISSNSKYIYLQSGLNDIAQEYPTATTSAQIACQNIKNAMSQITKNGQKVILIEEYGATGITGEKIRQLILLRKCQESYVLSNVGNVFLIDLAPVIYTTDNSSTSSVGFKSGYSSDGTHLNNYGAYYVGNYFKQILQTVIPTIPLTTSIVASYQDVSNAGGQILSNPTFLTTSSISATGVTGVGPSNWVWSRTGGATATVSMEANSESVLGNASVGNEAVVSLSCSAKGDTVNLTQSPNISTWSFSKKYIGTGSFMVESGSVNFAGVQLHVTLGGNVSGNLKSRNSYAMYSNAAGNPKAGVNIEYEGRLVTPVTSTPIGSASNWYAQYSYEIQCAGAGNSVVHLRPAGMFEVE